MKTITELLMNYEPTDTMKPNRFTTYLHRLTPDQRKELQDLYKAGLLPLKDHRDELQAVLTCENAYKGIEYDKSGKPYRPKNNKPDGPAESMNMDQAIRSIHGI